MDLRQSFWNQFQTKLKKWCQHPLRGLEDPLSERVGLSPLAVEARSNSVAPTLLLLIVEVVCEASPMGGGADLPVSVCVGAAL
ncbi:MAG: hypothetical protein JSS32_03750 [Verrucomicrobia bacterium]|nr:hypothetical protein [Verrucomicrobiota bacterium]